MALARPLGLLLLASILPAQEERTDAAVDAALARYRELGLPEPPAEAPLVLLQSGATIMSNGVTQVNPPYATFRLAPKADGTSQHLRGTVVDDRKYRVLQVDPKPEELDPSKWLTVDPSDDFARDQELATGLQLWARGLRDAARQLVWRRDDGRALAERVAQLAASHWQAQVVESDVPLPEIARRLRAAVASMPEGALLPQTGFRGPTTPWSDVLRRIETATLTPAAKPDANTSLVLGLVHSRRPGGMGFRSEPDAPFEAVVRQGFSIVPALLAHFEDDRTTRSLFTGMNNARSYIRPLGELAAEALQQISGGAIGGSHRGGERITREGAEAWWREAQNRSEDEYMVERFLATANELDMTGPMRVLGAKFPERLELAILELVEKQPGRLTHVVVDTIADSTIRKSKKIELLERVAEQKKERLQALRRLAGIDEERFCARTIDVLRNAPTKLPKELWTSPDANFGHLVALTANQAVWDEFVRAARRADIGLRMEYMGPFDYSYLGNTQRNQRIACLAAFLDDAEVWDVAKSGQSGPHAAFAYKKVAMCDYAANKLAGLLGVGRRCSSSSSAEEWAALREDVRQAMAKAGIEAMQVAEQR